MTDEEKKLLEVLTPLGFRWERENADLAGSEKLRAEFCLEAGRLIDAGIEPEKAIDLATQDMREAVGSPRPASKDEYFLEQEIARLNTERRSWGMQ